MGDNLFEGLPPPSHQQQQNQQLEESGALKTAAIEPSPAPAPPNPVLKSALKRPKPQETNPRVQDGNFLHSFVDYLLPTLILARGFLFSKIFVGFCFVGVFLFLVCSERESFNCEAREVV
uniref:Uncharacterized protein n=1 Tax=Rhizophora mucronata TaxID=61149 RepID=A0A2P2K9E5_RHIMU